MIRNSRFCPKPTLPRSVRNLHFPRWIVLILLCLCWILYFTRDESKNTKPLIDPNEGSSHPKPSSEGSLQFWNEYSTYLAEGKPSFKEVAYAKEVPPPWISFDYDGPSKRPDRAQLNVEEYAELKSLHSKAVKGAKDLAPRLPFNKGTRGIITSAANDALTIMTTSLRMLRVAGSTLPVEVLINDYEEVPCEKIFPQFGARCIFISDFLPENMNHSLEYDHFAYKSAAVLFSTFEQVLYIDADAFPVDDVEDMFIKEPFNSTGFVLWPDYWANTASRLFFDIAQLQVPSINERASTESGALLINKDKVASALLLAGFYNQWGPEHWYRLLSQGSTGEGDKETWLAAVKVMGLDFFQVTEPPEHLGYKCGGTERSVATGQHDPYEDYLLVSNDYNRASKVGWLKGTAPHILFIHGNLPKYDAPSVMGWSLPNWNDQLRCPDKRGNSRGKAHRMWGPKELTVRKFGWDVEKSVWDSMRWVGCTYPNAYTMWVNGTWHSKPVDDTCGPIVDFYAEVLPESLYDPSLPRPEKLEGIRKWWIGRSLYSV